MCQVPLNKYRRRVSERSFVGVPNLRRCLVQKSRYVKRGGIDLIDLSCCMILLQNRKHENHQNTPVHGRHGECHPLGIARKGHFGSRNRAGRRAFGETGLFGRHRSRRLTQRRDANRPGAVVNCDCRRICKARPGSATRG